MQPDRSRVHWGTIVKRVCVSHFACHKRREVYSLAKLPSAAVKLLYSMDARFPEFREISFESTVYINSS
jgi:hypothetical protein